MDERDERFLRRAFEVARRAVEHGNMPFGAILVDRDGIVVLEAENLSLTEHDPTAHAETTLMREAGRRFDPDYLAGCTMYTSAEPMSGWTKTSTIGGTASPIVVSTVRGSSRRR